jgi:hypothetical protein
MKILTLKKFAQALNKPVEYFLIKKYSLTDDNYNEMICILKDISDKINVVVSKITARG